MKFDLLQQLVNINGQPETQIEALGFDPQTGRPNKFTETPLSVGLVLKTLLNSPKLAGEEETYDIKVKRGMWAISISKGDSPDFQVEDLALIKKLLFKSGFENIVIAQMNQLIEDKVN